MWKIILILCFTARLSAAKVISENIKIDWTKVKPLAEYREFWNGKPFQPPSDFSTEQNMKEKQEGLQTEM